MPLPLPNVFDFFSDARLGPLPRSRRGERFDDLNTHGIYGDADTYTCYSAVHDGRKGPDPTPQ
jgi:hypothetical protein